MRSFLCLVLAVLAVAIVSTSVQAGPILNRLKARREAAACSTSGCAAAGSTAACSSSALVPQTAPGFRLAAPLAPALKAALARMAADRVIKAGRMTEAEYQTVIAVNTGPDGSINWTGVIQLLQALVADLPAIIAFIQAIIPLFGG